MIGDTSATAVLPEFDIRPRSVTRIPSGLINASFAVTDMAGTRFVLQWVNPIFPPTVNVDIENVTAHLAAKGLSTPRLVRSAHGESHVSADDGIWRLLTFIEGETLHTLPSEAHAFAAGFVLGQFHRAMQDFTLPFATNPPPIHDTPRHLDHLRQTLAKRGGHARIRHVRPLAEEILSAAKSLPALPCTPERVVHGDPKISNILFARETPRAICMIDLDRVGRMRLPLELGDALRSWCNPAGEDTETTTFSEPLFSATLRGYAEANASMPRADEIAAIIPATAMVCLELAARFCADALNEDYFAWDPDRYPGHSEHSEIRAAGQLHLYRLVQQHRDRLENLLSAVIRNP